jgi:hypothetical protein
MTAVNPETAELLAILDGADPMGLSAWTEAAAPKPLNAHGHIDFRTRATRQWFERWEALMRAAIDTIDAGYAEFVGQADDEPEQFAITDAGRRYLAEMRALP